VEFKKRKKNTLHPTMKPVELITMALGDQSDKKIVYDGFLGSGSTIIACEKTKRKCYGMELDPKYCDVIVKRWEQFTGLKAELENGQN
jgi:DNA modification methylase